MTTQPEVLVNQIKTCLTIVLGVAFACALSNRAHAAALTTSGELRVRGWSLESYLTSGRRVEFWDQRLRLALDFDVAERTNVHARADILEGQWGENSQRPAIVFDEVYAQFVLPGAPLRFTVGRQDVSWGTGYWTQADNRDRLAVGLRLDPVIVQFAYDKFAEAFTHADNDDDSRAWAVGAIANAGSFKLGLLVAHLEDDSRLRFPAGDLAYWAGDLYAIGAIGPVDTRVEVVYGSGTIERPVLGDLDVRGIGAYAAASVPLGPATLTLEGAYAGGDDPQTAGRQEGFFSGDYQGPFCSLIFYNTMDIAGFAGSAQSSSFEADFSVRNARAGKLSVSVTPLPGLTVTGAALYAVADQTPAGVDSSLGWEFDLVAAYRVADGVTLSAGVGYAVLGDYWNSAPAAPVAGAPPAAPSGPAAPSAPAAAGEGPENPLGGVVALTVAF